MVLLIGNDHYVKLTGLKNGLDDTTVADATVSLTVLDVNGSSEISGATWPVVMSPVSGSPGDYAGMLPRETNLVVGTPYNVRVEIEDTNNELDAQFDVIACCERRIR